MKLQVHTLFSTVHMDLVDNLGIFQTLLYVCQHLCNPLHALLYRVSILHASVFHCYNNAIFTNFTRGFKEEIINEHFYIQGGEG